MLATPVLWGRSCTRVRKPFHVSSCFLDTPTKTAKIQLRFQLWTFKTLAWEDLESNWPTSFVQALLLSNGKTTLMNSSSSTMISFFHELQGLGDTSEPCFTLEELKADYDDCYAFGFIMGCMHSQVTYFLMASFS